MSGKVREKGEIIRRFILENIEKHDGDIAAVAAEKFSITRQAVNKHLLRLREQGTLIREGSARSPKYKVAPLLTKDFIYDLTPELEEDVIWSRDIKPIVEPLPGNVLYIWHHVFTEMFNNAIDHSRGRYIFVKVRKTAISTIIELSDDGIGIFKKIQTEFNLLDERHAIFELAKGKLTTDPRNHSGEGIFFSSRMMDKFSIISGGLIFDHQKNNPNDWLVERPKPENDGTWICMELNNHTARTTKKVFDEYSSGEDYAFNKTVIPVNLAKYGADELVSRSQAKRLLARIELFKKVVFDFEGVDTIGQAFADQIFRVFAKDHKEIELIPINLSGEVKNMIVRARLNLE